jgi:hypothetical protein
MTLAFGLGCGKANWAKVTIEAEKIIKRVDKAILRIKLVLR